MSATELLMALTHAGAPPVLGKSISVHPGLRAACDTPFGCRHWCRAGRFLPVSGARRPAVASAILAALSLSLAGCNIPQPVSTTRLIAPSRANTEGAHELAATPKPLEAPSTPAQPAPQPARLVSETKAPPAAISETRPAPATASRGAEKLVALGAPTVVRARERTTIPAEPSGPKAPTAEVSGTVTDAPVQALIVRGPPPQDRPRGTATKALVWLGLGLGGAALAVLARLYLIRRAKPAELANAGKDELKPAPGLLFKEPLNLPQKTVMADQS